ncbi:hypothetical protein LPJ73_000460 [Coemansia sp. RSA 2703]|nr:hypothetical protein LPJ73_000460 [Coemansia sp. RSA 2703]KAJ2378987.1 hypothetical protein IW150_000462 [Coemansia sp. RSA 2607]KAJ2397831.1 hypothetical protein GGI05_000436 [Coemansia sp. RSA 2603]
MSMHCGVPEGRPTGAMGKPEDVAQTVEPLGAKVKSAESIKLKAAVQAGSVPKREEECPVKQDVRMDHMERRLDDICALLENLMIDHDGGGYYEGEEGTPSPMTGRACFEYQEPPLFSMPSEAVRGQASSTDVARAAPGRAHGVSSANNPMTLYSGR